MPRRRQVVVSAEHGGNAVPEAYGELFRGHESLLASHCGWDPGSLELARALAARLGAPLIYSTTSRLVVELNRSVGHRQLFSPITRGLDAARRREVLERYYHPHRREVTAAVSRAIAGGSVAVHLGIHTFVPCLDGCERHADVGLLYDPAREAERGFCREALRALAEIRPDLRTRRNYPYLGSADGLTTALRKRFEARDYLGIEIEVNQKFPLGDEDVWQSLVEDLGQALQAALSPSRD